MPPARPTLEVLEATSRGRPVEASSVSAFVANWIGGVVSDVQVAAWLVACGRRGEDRDIADGLLDGLLASGERLDLTQFGETVALQTAGGPGAPAVVAAASALASQDARVLLLPDPGICGRSGLADVIAAIAGLVAVPDLATHVRQVRDTGMASIGDHPRLAPAICALRGLAEETGETGGPCVNAALLVARAVAGGARRLVVDVTYGAAGCVADRDAAVATGNLVVRLAARWNREAEVFIRAVDDMVGRAAGPLLELRETASLLGGGGPEDLRDLAAAFGGGGVPSAMEDGAARAAAERWVVAQGGERDTWADSHGATRADVVMDVPAPTNGVIQRIRADHVVDAARWVGAGRMHRFQHLDNAVGVELLVGVGEPATRDEPLARIRARDPETAARAQGMLLAGIEIAPDAPVRRATIERLGPTVA